MTATEEWVDLKCKCETYPKYKAQNVHHYRLYTKAQLFIRLFKCAAKNFFANRSDSVQLSEKVVIIKTILQAMVLQAHEVNANGKYIPNSIRWSLLFLTAFLCLLQASENSVSLNWQTFYSHLVLTNRNTSTWEKSMNFK